MCIFSSDTSFHIAINNVKYIMHISKPISAVFLINVVRVLCNKLHPGTAQLAPLALQKALRATLILVSHHPNALERHGKL